MQTCPYQCQNPENVSIARNNYRFIELSNQNLFFALFTPEQPLRLVMKLKNETNFFLGFFLLWFTSLPFWLSSDSWLQMGYYSKGCLDAGAKASMTGIGDLHIFITRA